MGYKARLLDIVTRKQTIFVCFVVLAIIMLFVRHDLARIRIYSLETKLDHLHATRLNFGQSTVKRNARPVVIPKVYELQQDGFYRLPNVQDNEAELQYKSETNIYFIISTVFKDGLATMNPRQSCAVESAARANPKWKVFVFFVDSRGFSFFNSTDIVSLLSLQNVYLRNINLSTIAVGTPMEEFLASGKLKNASFLVENTSDVLRWLVVYKYGGTYLDTDVVVFKTFDELPLDYLVSGGGHYVVAGYIALQATGVGHEVATLILKEMVTTFNGTRYAANGPALVTRVMQRFCNATEPWHMTREQCGGQMVVLPPGDFFQVYYPYQRRFFEEKHKDEVMKLTQGKVVTHIWNRLTSGIKLRKDSKVAYVELAKKYCPNVLKFCDGSF